MQQASASANCCCLQFSLQFLLPVHQLITVVFSLVFSFSCSWDLQFDVLINIDAVENFIKNAVPSRDLFISCQPKLERFS